jgi:branched-chain amino acid transport system permease protein
VIERRRAGILLRAAFTIHHRHRNMLLLIEQILNGVQLGLLLFLLAAGLTLVFGIMDMVNLAHGSLYMMGAYFAATFVDWTGSFFLGLLLALPAAFLLGVVLERVALSTLYSRDHLDQVLATFGLILFFNELVRLVWGPGGRTIPLPTALNGTVTLLPGLDYPIYRLIVIVVGAAVAFFLYWLVAKTKLGMRIRAGASNREMIGALGVDIRLLYTLVFGLGAAFAALAGIMTAPITTAQIGMGESILIIALVVIVIGGIGSIRGAFVAALLVGMIDTMGRAFLPELLRAFMSAPAANTLAPALASMLIYLLMALVLFLRPEGLFPARQG